MKYSLKPKDLSDIKNFLENSPHAKAIREYNRWKFEVGDVIIRYTKSYDGTKSPDMVSQTCPVPKKYRVVYIDELNVPWVKQVLVRGGLGSKLFCLLNYNNPNSTWELDPEQVDASLLGYKYDPRVEYKRMRTENPGYGGKKANKK